jgi:transposase
MKFKQRYAENQRIERITTQHLVIGIDIAKETHVARAVNFRGIEIGRHISFRNSDDGFTKLLHWYHKLQESHGYTSVLIGLEPTGHYWFSLADWLTARHIELVLVNPLTTKRNKENRDNSQSKNDVKDALVIADAVCRGFYSLYTPNEAIYQRLRTIMNNRESWSKDLAHIKNRMYRWIDINFPEYGKIFKDWTIPRSIATLKSFPLPIDLKALSAEEIITGWRMHMKRAGGSSGLQKAALLLAESRRSIGRTTCEQEERQNLKYLLEDYEKLAARLKEIEQEILKLLDMIPDITTPLRSIKGLSTLFIAAILAGTGDLRNYTHGNQILSHAGLNLAEDSSGKHKGKIVISKRGRRQLRKYLYLAVVHLVTNNPAFRSWHDHNVQVKKMKKNRSIFKLIGKLARILIGISRSKGHFDPTIAMPLQEAA